MNQQDTATNTDPTNTPTRPNTPTNENAGDSASVRTNLAYASNCAEIDGELVPFKRDWMPAMLAVLRTSRVNVAQACEAVGISRSTFFRWKALDPAFAAVCWEIEEATTDLVESSLYERAIDAKDVDAIKFALTNRRRERWSNRSVQEVDGSVQIAHTVEVLQGKEPRQVDAERRHAAAALLLGGNTDTSEVVTPPVIDGVEVVPPSVPSPPGGNTLRA